MGKSDTLTYSASTEVSDTDDNHNQIILVLRQLYQIATTVIAGLNLIEEQIWESSEKKAEVVSALEKMKKMEPCKLADGAAE